MISTSRRHAEWEIIKKSTLYWFDPFQGYLPVWYGLRLYPRNGHAPACMNWSK